MGFDELREVKTKSEEIQLKKLTVKKLVNNPIAFYNAKTDNIDSLWQQKINKVYIDKEYKDLITVQIPRIKSAYDKMVATFKLFFNFI